VNLDAVRAELPADVVTWLTSFGASEDTWMALARDAAVLVGRRLLAGGGDAGWYLDALEVLLHDPSPAVRAIAAELPFGVRRWTARDTARLACEHFGLANADRLARVLHVK